MDPDAIITMKRLVYPAFGDPDVLRLVDSPRPEPGPHEVRIRVAAAGLNPIDWKTRKGMGFVASRIASRLPWTPGYDLAGVVDTVGPEVSSLVPGDRVLGMVGFSLDGGACSQFVVAPADALAIVPDELSLTDAAALPLAGLTAWQALFDLADLQSGHKLLVHAGAGGVGHLAVQFALIRGAHVVATASAGNRDFLSALGVHEVVDYNQSDFVDECYGLDAVLDLVGGETGRRSLHTLSEQGVLVTIPTFTADEVITAAEDQGLRAYGMTVRPVTDQLEEILELVEDGDVRVHVDEVFPASQAAEAHRVLEGGHVRGKLVLDFENP